VDIVEAIKEAHNRRTCPAGKPGVYCRNCYGANHFAIVCRSPKDHFKRQWLGKTRNEKQVKGQVNALNNSSDTDEGEHLNYFALSLHTQCEFIYDVMYQENPQRNCLLLYHCPIRVTSLNVFLFKLILQQLVTQCHLICT
jgi:hypothetical protein